jgi:c-di-GMP-binding flagellar brake protein YcgR
VSSAERRWKRLKVDIRVRLRRWEEAEDAASLVRSYEMSEGGMSVYAPGRLEIGTFVVVAFSLPAESYVLRIRAVVRNERGFRYGLEYVDLADADRFEIVRYLGSLAGVAEG